ncbi:type II secretion system F family protein [Paenibacillus thermotolerans]|uniref:type II secretion system F family protein n=1 Tax=Paenibacillus thermotolerans TaxID=3027807 RepID=UPI00236780FE|nr:type II secretion system F family protein [Paenibacillus sp. YIM B05602]
MRITEAIAVHAPGIVRSVTILYGKGERGGAPLQRWTATVTAACGCGLLFAIGASLLFQDAAFSWFGAAFFALVPLLMWKDLERRTKERHRAFVSELPVFVHKMSLLIGAGETVQGAWVRASLPSVRHSAHPLYEQLERMRNELNQSVPFARALELFSQRCGIPEVSFLVTTTLMNYRRGGEAFAAVLQQTGRTMIEKKRALMKTMGEEASTKMVFPMVLIFGAMMCVVAAPAVMLMGNSL